MAHGDAFNQPAPVRLELPDIWSCMSDEEKTVFWKFAAKDICNLSHSSPEFNRVCGAIREADRSGDAKRPINGLPSAARHLSAGDIQVAVARLKDRLLDQPATRRYLNGSFGRWLQQEKLKALLLVLDAVNCPRDERGSLKGKMPEFSPAHAARVICDLSEHESARDLALCCGGLLLNNPNWSGLNDAFHALKEISSDSLGSTQRTHDDCTIPTQDDILRQHTMVRSTLESVKDGFAELQHRLSSVGAELSDQQLPDLNDAIVCWRMVGQKFNLLAQELSVKTLKVADLEAAFESYELKKKSTVQLARCVSIFHISDAAFAGVQVISAICAQIQNDLTSGRGDDQTSALASVSALLKLVEDEDKLSDDEASLLGERVRETFGQAVATAALRGKLVFQAEPLASECTKVSECANDPMLVEYSKPDEGAPKALLHQGESVGASDSSDGPVGASLVSSVQDNDSLPDATTSPRAEDDALPIEQSLPDQSPPPAIESGTGREHAHLTEPHSVPRTVSELGAKVKSDEEPCPYVNFETYRITHWVDDTGSVAIAPWCSEDHVDRMSQSITATWDENRLELSYLFSRAVSTLEMPPQLDPEELAHADRLLREPANAVAAVDIERAARLRASLKPVAAGQPRTFGISVILEALRPAHPCNLDASEIDRILEIAAFKNPALADVASFLLKGWASEFDPLGLLRSRLNDGPDENLGDLELALSKAQSALRNEVAALWSAAGGKIQRTHCRKAWTEFIQKKVVPLRDGLAPNSNKASSQVTWSPERIRECVTQLGRAYATIMDDFEVNYKDRIVANNAAEQIVSAIDRVADAMQRLSVQHQRSRATFDGCPHEQAKRLMAETSSDPTDQLCALLLRAALKREPVPSPLRFPTGYLVSQPDLARYLKPLALQGKNLVDEGIDIRDFTDIVATSFLLENWRTIPVPICSNDAELLVAIRDDAVERSRLDILAALSSTTVLQPHERTLLHLHALKLGDEIFEASCELERIWGTCDELLVPVAETLKTLVDQAKVLTGSSHQETSIGDELLLREWLSKLIFTATRDRDKAVQALTDLAYEHSGAIGQRVHVYFSNKNYRAAVALLHGGVEPLDGLSIAKVRRTLWRKEAFSTYEEPQRGLLNELRGETAEQQKLVELWVTCATDPGQRDQLRRLVYAVISGEAGRSPAENVKRFPIKLSDLRDHKERKTIISCAAIREYFRRSKLNPTFIPQLADFSQIVLTTSPAHTAQSTSILDDWSRVVNTEAAGSLVVFLVPGMPVARRDELCSSLRRRGVAITLIDDIDLCRLCAAAASPEGHDFIPFLEVILEQLDLERASPFSSLDGQNVRLETYIGRSQEAQMVALGGRYTRVFSGRKLGKSALLKYVATTYDREKLPSGNTLHVFFITIAGGESEGWVVNCIVDEMSARFDLVEPEESKRMPSAERFSSYMKRFTQAKQKDSVLLILDEADAFIEGQLARYDKDREGSLSFRMMKELPAQVDSNQLPRIRIIFSGYRVTNTRGGVWANAGDVLVLRPLSEEEAVQFLQGMLARVGVDIENHAPFIARRCGFQPAVLIRFGESLLKRLKRAPKLASRETLQVAHEEVLATLNEQGVLDEIRTVVNNNFQGNRVGAVIFGATLLALKDLEPGLALTEGPTQVLSKIREIDPDLDWLEKIDVSPSAEIERNLEDFIDRELLTVTDAPRFGGREYRLRIPHFLPVLTQQSGVALEVRQQIQAIRISSTLRRVSECLLSESALDVVRYWHRQEDISECKLVVVAGHWPSALLDDKCGVPDRLGCDRNSVARGVLPDDTPGLFNNGIRVFGAIHSTAWQCFLDHPMPRPAVVVGGLDLLRLAKRYVLDGGDVPVEVITLGRLTEATLSWWFEEARALHFKTADAVMKIMRLTEGIPFLVACLDQLLELSAGSDVTAEYFRDLLETFKQRLPNFARKLVEPESDVCLKKREIELLCMAVRVAREVADEFDLEREFLQSWELCNQDTDDAISPPMSEPGDRLALELLTEVGLLQLTTSDARNAIALPLGRVRITNGSAIVTLVDVLESCGAC